MDYMLLLCMLQHFEMPAFGMDWNKINSGGTVAPVATSGTGTRTEQDQGRNQGGWTQQRSQVKLNVF